MPVEMVPKLAAGDIPRTLTTQAIRPEQLLAVWDLTLQSDPEGPSLISRAARLPPGCLHGLPSAPSWRTADRDLPGALRVRGAAASSPKGRALQRHRFPHCRLDGPANRRSVSRRLGAA